MKAHECWNQPCRLGEITVCSLETYLFLEEVQSVVQQDVGLSVIFPLLSFGFQKDLK